MKKAPSIRRADFFRAYILADYHLGLRLADLLSLGPHQVGPQGQVVVAQAKTGDVVIGHLPPDVHALIRGLMRLNNKRIFGDLLNYSNAQRWMRRLVEQAGLRGSTKWLRRTGATWCEVHSPGSAKAYCGHRTAGLAFRNYVDPRFVQQRKPGPPPVPENKP